MKIKNNKFNFLRKILLFKISLILLFFSCTENYTPKPRGYIRDNFPEKKYRLFDTIFPYAFEYPVYAKIIPDKNELAEDYWINIQFPERKATIHLSYKSIENNLSEFEEDTRKFAYKHTIKADAINTIKWENNEKSVYGLLYEIKGNVASQVQFYLTDSTKHFLRASLYFNVRPNKDSIAPSVKFLRKDIDKMIETFFWK